VVVYKVDSEHVSFRWKESSHKLPVAKFSEAWSGVVLLAEKSEKSIEPGYREHRKTQLLNLAKQTAFLFSCGLILFFAYTYKLLYANAGISLLLLINLAGMYIGWLLLLKQMNVQSQYADKICSLFRQSNCNSVLESEAAKLFGIFSWSEIGFGYFSANVLLLLLSPSLVTSIALINILTLPFTLWSVWYQQVKARQWCTLCLTVVVCLWAIFIINLLFGYIQIPDFYNSMPVLTKQVASLLVYCMMILGVHLLAPKFNTEKTVQSLKQSINSIKSDGDVFAALLKKQPFYETNDNDSIINFGNPDSKLRLTVLTNPYCNPCSKMHKRIEELLKKTNSGISIQYILSSFNEALNSTNKYLIAVCLSEKTGSAMQIFGNWFEKGKALRDEYFKDMCLDMDNPEIEVEFQKHEIWRKKTQLRSTPTVLVNGYQLPEIYKVEDLRYFMDLDL